MRVSRSGHMRVEIVADNEENIFLSALLGWHLLPSGSRNFLLMRRLFPRPFSLRPVKRLTLQNKIVPYLEFGFLRSKNLGGSLPKRTFDFVVLGISRQVLPLIGVLLHVVKFLSVFPIGNVTPITIDHGIFSRRHVG